MNYADFDMYSSEDISTKKKVRIQIQTCRMLCVSVMPGNVQRQMELNLYLNEKA